MKSVVPFQSKRFLRLCCILFAGALFAGILPTPPTAGKIVWQDEPGKLELQKICKGCHELEKAYSIKQDRNGWVATMEKMVSFGMKSSDEEYKAVLEYLVKHYAADDVPRVKVNKATAIELESGLSLKRSQAKAVIEYREKNGAFKSIEDLKKVPGLEAYKLEAKKDRLSFEQ
jgi:competence protein ComEA